MDTKQIKTLEWLDSLENYAKEKRLSMRIIDGIEECKRKVESKKVDWMAVNHKIEDLTGSIEQKTVPAVSQNNSENQVSLQSIKEQIKKMAQRCQTENQASIGSITERKNLVVKKSYDDLREITYTKAHLQELKNQNDYLHFYEQEKSEYERNGFQMLRELLQDISSNYDHLLEHIKSMLSSIGGYKIGVGNEKIYYDFETKREGLDTRLQSEISSLDIGGNKIIDFGKKTVEPVKKTVKKFIRKRKLLAWIPFLILILGLVTGSAVTRKDNIEKLQAQSVDSKEDEQSAWLSDIGKQMREKAINSVSTSVISKTTTSFAALLSTLIAALGSVLLAIILIIIVLYAAYLRMLKAWCNSRICTECEKYLRAELDMFIGSDSLMPVLDEAIKTAVKEYEEEYLIILNQIFLESELDEANEEQKGIKRFHELKESWNKIKYE